MARLPAGGRPASARFLHGQAPSAADRFRQAGAPVPRLVPDPAFGLPAWPRAGHTPGSPGPDKAAADRRGRRGGGRLQPAARAVHRHAHRPALRPRKRLRPHHVPERRRDRRAGVRRGRDRPKRAFSTQLAAELAGLQRIGTVEFIAVDNMYDDAAASAAFAGALGGAPVRCLPRADAATLGAAFSPLRPGGGIRFHSVVLALQAGGVVHRGRPVLAPGHQDQQGAPAAHRRGPGGPALGRPGTRRRR